RRLRKFCAKASPTASNPEATRPCSFQLTDMAPSRISVVCRRHASAKRSFWREIEDQKKTARGIIRGPLIFQRRDSVGLLCGLPDRAGAAADGGTNQRALLATEDGADARSGCRGTADDHRSLLPVAARCAFHHRPPLN